jgi:hypothetical protein
MKVILLMMKKKKHNPWIFFILYIFFNFYIYCKLFFRLKMRLSRFLNVFKVFSGENKLIFRDSKTWTLIFWSSKVTRICFNRWRFVNSIKKKLCCPLIF